ncbi:MAG TPA: CPBP family intramembrane glutamic endopeptidase [Terracidiphilus sp.]|nr:CPBP family intramembrane glutamic endopeptidase [Terracidiphilus sp.]
MPHLDAAIIAAALLALLPYLAAAFFPAQLAGRAHTLPAWAQIALPALLAIPYAIVSLDAGSFHWYWLAVYALVPAALAFAARCFPRDERNIWLPLAVLLLLGLSVDLRWFERAWPPHLSVFNKVLLLDAGIYAFFLLNPLAGAGFSLRLRLRDLTTGLREFLFYLPIALPIGLITGFLHAHLLTWRPVPLLEQFFAAWIFTFFFIAVPEELFFRGWLQNLLERRAGRNAALILTAILFGLSHFNKRAAHFNTPYVVLAALAGVFYGRAWRRDRRVAASAITHATVDSIWSLFLR